MLGKRSVCSPEEGVSSCWLHCLRVPSLSQSLSSPCRRRRRQASANTAELLSSAPVQRRQPGEEEGISGQEVDLLMGSARQEGVLFVQLYFTTGKFPPLFYL